MHNKSNSVIAWMVCATLPWAFAKLSAQKPLPNAPVLQLGAAAGQAARMPTLEEAFQPQIPPTSPKTGASQNDGPQTSVQPNANAIQVGQPNSGPSLTIAQAEEMALRNNPNISVARLLALAQGEVTREVRSAEFPHASGDLTAEEARNNSRITGAGTLSSSRALNKAAGGLTVSQLITDFGRTHNLVKSATSDARAELENQHATELDIRLAVDQAFYEALTAQAVFRVAEQTVAQRQATSDQVGALAKSNVKSSLDLSFANVQVSQANLLLLDAKNGEQTAMAVLNNVLGSDQDQQYSLVDDAGGNLPPAPNDAEALVQTAYKGRPDLAALNDRILSARQYASAEHDLWFPTVSALASAGGAPVRDNLILTPWYGAVGANISIPIFNGFLYSAQIKEAKLRADAAQEKARNLHNVIARDVRTAVLNAQTAFERIRVTQEELNQADIAMDLAQARYKIGLSSIVELTQAQLAQTQAQIDNTNARYSYQTALAEVRYESGQ